MNRYANARGASGWIFFVFILTLLSGCVGDDGSSDTPAPQPPAQSSEPWKVTMLMGNFAVNSGNVTTHEDGASVDYLTDYVNVADLPTSSMEMFTLNAYIPTSDAYSVTVTGVNVTVRDMNANASPNIYYDDASQFIERITLGGQLYSVFRVAGFYSGGISRSNFANIVFTLQIAYKNGSSTVGTRTAKLEIFKGGTSSGDTTGGGSGSGSGSEPAPATGAFGIKVYRPTGACEAYHYTYITRLDGTREQIKVLDAYKGTLKAYYYSGTSGNKGSGFISLPVGMSQKDSSGEYWYTLYGPNAGTAGGYRYYRMEWEVRPDMSSYPTYCILSGAADIEFEGQTKNIVIKW